MGKCLIFCAAGFDGLAEEIKKEDYILAADGGLVHVEKLGLTPNGILGDFDSLGYTPEGSTVFPVEKDDTDAMLAIKKGLELGYKEFLLYGSLDGPRLDHTVANFQALQYLADRGATGSLIGKDYIVTCVKDGAIRFSDQAEGIISVFCMGASISALHGTVKVRGEEDKYVSVIGDSTFMHSGMTGLANVVYNGGNTTTLILDNSITGMTGHQENPLTGKTLKGTAAPNLSLEAICVALGVSPDHIRAVDPNNLPELEQILKEETAAPCASVIICRRPCALLKGVKRGNPVVINEDKCVGCRACMKIGCPCISIVEKKAKIDASMCVGCGLCPQMCRVGAIIEQ